MNVNITIGYSNIRSTVCVQVSTVVVWVFNAPFHRAIIAFFVYGPLAEILFKAVKEVSLIVAHIIAFCIAGPIQHCAG